MSYDIGTNVGKVRFRIADTDEANELFSNAEIEYCLSVTSDSIPLAAAMCLRALAADRVKLSKKITREGYSSEQFAIKEILDLAQALENEVGVELGDIPLGDDVFRTFRPDWRDDQTLSDVVE